MQAASGRLRQGSVLDRPPGQGLQALLPYRYWFRPLSGLLRLTTVITESEANAIRVVGVVVVGVAVAVDITKVVGVGCIRRPLPPIVRRQSQHSRA